jgi:hypothetical protein
VLADGWALKWMGVGWVGLEGLGGMQACRDHRYPSNSMSRLAFHPQQHNALVDCIIKVGPPSGEGYMGMGMDGALAYEAAAHGV